MVTSTFPTNRVDPFEIELEPNQGLLSEMNGNGDTRLIWNRENADEVDAAARMFNELRDKQFIAYKATGKEGAKGDQIREFDPAAERIIMVPRIVGG